MVLMTRVLYGASKHGTGKGHQNWIDSLRVYCKGGKGGNGLPQFGGPGGKGGDVVILCAGKESKSTSLVESLQDVFKKTFRGDPSKQKVLGENGDHSKKQKMVGQPGNDTILKVPPGIIITDDTTKKVIKTLDNIGERVVVANGGLGGGPTNNWLGGYGQARFIRLDMKLLADIGLVGFPNAGKSTFLKAVSRARPKIASYPFTTIKPNLGNIIYDDQREISVADLPGLIEGASYNVGMGHRFLRHVERTRLLVFVVDINGFQLNLSSEIRTPFETLTLLNRELELYNPELLRKPAVCLVNKMDAGDSSVKMDLFLSQMENRQSEELLQHLPKDGRPEQLLEFQDFIPMSAKFSPSSVESVKVKLRELVDKFDEDNSGLDTKYKEVVESVEKSLSETKSLLI